MTDLEKIKIFKKAKEYFGTTNSPSEAGWMLPDGVMLDFSGRKFGGSGGTRMMDHSEIGYVIPDEIGDMAEYPKYKFGSTGAIRMHPESGGFECKVKLTHDQYVTIRQYLPYFNRITKYIDLTDMESDRKHSAVYPPNYDVSKIVNHIKRFYAGEPMEEYKEYEMFESHVPSFLEFIYT